MLKFKKNIIPEQDYRLAIKKPIPIRCVQIQEPFMVETMEGNLRGKKGDWLMIGIQGEMYPIDKDIFERTYDLLPNN
jgi:hypothetical protein